MREEVVHFRITATMGGVPLEQTMWQATRMRDGKVVEHWGGPHCMYGIGLSPARTPHAETSERAA